jgi:tRNA modification GTPase
VGKSSLINALLGYGRSIVHPTAGTTRDVVTARTAVDGWPVLLADTAGLGAGGDALERAGIDLARGQLVQADLVLLVFDMSVPWSADDEGLLAAWPGALVVHNKSDAAIAPVASEPARPAGLAVSALARQGLDVLVRQMADRLVPHPPPPGAAVPFTPQQVETLQQMRKELGIAGGGESDFPLAATGQPGMGASGPSLPPGDG